MAEVFRQKDMRTVTVKSSLHICCNSKGGFPEGLPVVL